MTCRERAYILSLKAYSKPMDQEPLGCAHDPKQCCWLGDKWKQGCDPEGECKFGPPLEGRTVRLALEAGIYKILHSVYIETEATEHRKFIHTASRF